MGMDLTQLQRLGKPAAKPKSIGGYPITAGLSNDDIHYDTHKEYGVYDIGGNAIKAMGKTVEEVARDLSTKGFIAAARRKGDRNITNDHVHFVDPRHAPREAARLTAQAKTNKRVFVPTTQPAAGSSNMNLGPLASLKAPSPSTKPTPADAKQPARKMLVPEAEVWSPEQRSAYERKRNVQIVTREADMKEPPKRDLSFNRLKETMLGAAAGTVQGWTMGGISPQVGDEEARKTAAATGLLAGMFVAPEAKALGLLTKIPAVAKGVTTLKAARYIAEAVPAARQAGKLVRAAKSVPRTAYHLIRPTGIVKSVRAKQLGEDIIAPSIEERLATFGYDDWVDSRIDASKGGWTAIANRAAKDAPRSVINTPLAFMAFKAHLYDNPAETLVGFAEPFINPVESFKERPVDTFIMWALVGAQAGGRVKSAIKDSTTRGIYAEAIKRHDLGDVDGAKQLYEKALRRIPEFDKMHPAQQQHVIRDLHAAVVAHQGGFGAKIDTAAMATSRAVGRGAAKVGEVANRPIENMVAPEIGEGQLRLMEPYDSPTLGRVVPVRVQGETITIRDELGTVRDIQAKEWDGKQITPDMEMARKLNDDYARAQAEAVPFLEGEVPVRAGTIRRGEFELPQKAEAPVVPPRREGEVVPRVAFQNERMELLKDIDYEPLRFQFKESNLPGSTPFNAQWAGTIDVWRDPVDGRLKVINGHKRYKWAERDGETQIRAREVEGLKTAEEARLYGALKNITEGSGTAVDAARLFRTPGLSAEELLAQGVDLKAGVARLGMGIAKLNEDLFHEVATNRLSEKRGSMIGELIPDANDQSLLLARIREIESKGKTISDVTLNELINNVRAGQVSGGEQTGFGFITDLSVDRANLAAHIIGELQKNSKKLEQAIKDKARLELGGNKIDAKTSKRIAREAAQVGEVVNNMRNQPGKISDILNEGARRISDGEAVDTVRSEVYRRITETVSGAIVKGNLKSLYGSGARPAAPPKAKDTPEPVAKKKKATPKSEAKPEALAKAEQLAETVREAKAKSPAPKQEAVASEKQPWEMTEGEYARHWLNFKAGLHENGYGVLGPNPQPGTIGLEVAARYREAARTDRIKEMLPDTLPEIARDRHYAINEALSEGKRVPDAVVDQFIASGGKLPETGLHPDLAAKYAKTKAKPEAPKPAEVAEPTPEAEPVVGAWISLLDGEIEQVVGRGKAEANDWNHAYYLDPAVREKMDMGEVASAWFDKDGNVISGWYGETASPADIAAVREKLKARGYFQPEPTTKQTATPAPAEGALRGTDQPLQPGDAVILPRQPKLGVAEIVDAPATGKITIQVQSGTKIKIDAADIQRVPKTTKAWDVPQEDLRLGVGESSGESRAMFTPAETKTGKSAERAAAEEAAKLQKKQQADKAVGGMFEEAAGGTTAEASIGGYTRPKPALPPAIESQIRRHIDVTKDRVTAVELPEMVEAIRELGVPVNVVKSLRAGHGQATGMFAHKGESGRISLRRDIFLGDEIASLEVPKGQIALAEPGTMTTAKVTPKFNADRIRQIVAERLDVPLEEIVVRIEPGKADNALRYRAYRVNENLAAQILAHEIGHAADWMPEGTTARGNILGHVASLQNWMRKTIGELPRTPDDFLSPKEQAKLRRQVNTQLKGSGLKGEELKVERKRIYDDLLAQEVKRRGLIKAEDILNELKHVSQLWRPFDPAANAKFTKYRYSPKELYADAVSVLLNDPVMLETQAPTFYRAFMDYLERKPGVLSKYEETLSLYTDPRAVAKHRIDNLYGMVESGEAVRSKAYADRQRSTETFVDSVTRYLIDKNWPALKGIGKREKGTGAQAEAARQARLQLEELAYTDAEIAAFLHEVNTKVHLPMAEKGVGYSDLGVLGFVRRVQADRSQIANPLGHGKRSAAEIEAALKEFDSKVMSTQDLLRAFRLIYESKVLDKPEARHLYGQEGVDYFKSQKDYLKFEVQHWMAEKHGNTISARVHHQEGTLADIANPYISTVLQAMRMIKAMKVNEVKRAVVDDLVIAREARPAETVYSRDAKGQVPKQPPDQHTGTITLMRDGKAEHYWVDRQIAELFEYHPRTASQLQNVWTAGQGVLRDLLVSKNPAWMARNIFRDFWQTYKNLPQIGPLEAFKLVKEYGPAMVEAARMAFKDADIADIAKMRESYALPTQRMYGRRDIKVENELEAIQQEMLIAMLDHKQAGKLAGAWDKFYDTLDKFGRISEVSGKLAGWRYLEKHFGDMPVAERAHLVRTRVGTPDFKRRGAGAAILNNIFLFSTVNKEGLRATLEGARQNPTSYLVKSLMSQVASKGVLVAAGAGVLGPTLQRCVNGISDYDKAMYQCIPLPVNREDGKSVYLRFPMSYDDQMIGALAWRLLQGDTTKAAKELANAAPWGLQSLHPFVQVGMNSALYATGINPQDWHSGSNIVNQTTFETGGWDKHKAMGKWIWSELGGRTLYTPSWGGIMPDQSAIEKALKLPGLNAFGSFLRISDRGHEERLQEEANVEKRVADKRRAQVTRRIMTEINAGRTKEADANSLYRQLVDDKLIDKRSTSRTEFSRRYLKYALRSVDAPWAGVFSGKSNAQKAAMLRHYRQTMPPQEYQRMVKTLTDHKMLSAEVIRTSKQQ